MTHPHLPFDAGLIDDIAARMDLRTPNRAALEAVAKRIDGAAGSGIEVVCDLATAVGKTYLAGGLIEYVAHQGVRNILVVVPGRTILRKTVDNFTPGHPKSVLGGMDTQPLVITVENFNTGAVASALEDEDQVKLFVFTVQSLLRPDKTTRRTRKFQEWLGEDLYAYLAGREDLVILSDEHHVYSDQAEAFSAVIRDLDPVALVGLTATPAKSDLPKVIYEYPLARAIADKYVKTPVLVGRKDKAAGREVQLRDGLALLNAKQRAADEYAQLTGKKHVNAVMFIVADSIDNANEVAELLRRPGMFEHDYEERVLTIHSQAPDDALMRLAAVEEPDSPVRVIVSVSMLKEGWDVKNIFVICSFRPSISDSLTEQTLGRGLRLPWGEYTGVELLDTVEVLSHERYEALLERADVLLEGLVEKRVKIEPTALPDVAVVGDGDNSNVSDEGTGSQDGGTPGGLDEPPSVTEPGSGGLGAAGSTPDVPGGSQADAGAGTGVSGTGATQPGAVPPASPVGVSGGTPSPSTGPTPVVGVPQGPAEVNRGAAIVASLEERKREAEAQVPKPVPARKTIALPHVVRSIEPKPPLKLSDIDEALFEKLGGQVAAAGGTTLNRKRLDIEDDPTSPTGLRLVPREATDVINAAIPQLPFGDVEVTLKRGLLHADFVASGSKADAGAAKRLAAALVRGAGGEEHVAPYANQVISAALKLLLKTHKAAPEVEKLTVEADTFGPTRVNARPEEANRFGKFSRGVAYSSWSERALHTLNWFDTEPERRMANFLDEAGEATVPEWARIQRGEFVVQWKGGRYSPDFVAVINGEWYLIEVKGDDRKDADEVQAKKAAAEQWARYVSDEGDYGTWRYLFVPQSVLKDAKTLQGVLTGARNA